METPTLKQLSKIVSSTSFDGYSKRNVILRKLSAGMMFFTSDMLILLSALIISLLIRSQIWPGEVIITKYFSFMPYVIVMFHLAFYLRGLYPGFGIDVIEELRTLTIGITVVYSIIATMSFLFKDAWDYSRLAFLLSWLLSVICVPLGRAFIRKMFGNKSWWGIPVLIIGAGKAGEKVINSLVKHRQVGLKPLLAVDDNVDRWGYINQIPVVGGLDIIPNLAQKMKIDQAIIAMPSINSKRQHEIIEKYSKYFSFITVIPDLYGIASLWVSTRDLGGILGLEVQQRLLKKTSILQKRIFDILLASTLGLIALPLILLIAIMIKIDSRGKIFFRQERMGIKDSKFKIVKFRTMHVDAEQRLSDILKHNDDLRQEYDVYHKMRNDPRLTRVGRFLRKFSLDELPQFWNVIKGDMSLIGPRAYMPWEKYKMNGNAEMILSVKPGISGLWQVTDRNASSFEERNNTDVYYIRNWSMFLDIYIVARTIGVILTAKGAY